MGYLKNTYSDHGARLLRAELQSLFSKQYVALRVEVRSTDLGSLINRAPFSSATLVWEEPPFAKSPSSALRQ